MSLLRHHVFLMLFYAVATALFFALLWRENREQRLRFFIVVFSALFFGGLILGWVMFPFPLK